LIGAGEWDEDRHSAMADEIAGEVRKLQKEAESIGVLPEQGFNRIGSMFEDVFEELPWHLREQSEQAMRERRIKWPDWKE
jgi:2-oxoisovalerate dehydrogenase E1 component alpha subunit